MRLRWTALKDAETYDIDKKHGISSRWEIVVRSNATTIFEDPWDMEYDRQIYRIRGVDKQGGQGPWSASIILEKHHFKNLLTKIK